MTELRDPEELYRQFDHWTMFVDESMMHYEHLQEKCGNYEEKLRKSRDENESERKLEDTFIKATERLNSTAKKAAEDHFRLLELEELHESVQSQLQRANESITELKRESAKREREFEICLKKEKEDREKELSGIQAEWRKQLLDLKNDSVKEKAAHEILVAEMKDSFLEEKAKMISDFQSELRREMNQVEERLKKENDLRLQDFIHRLETKNKNEEWMLYKNEQRKVAWEKEKAKYLKEIDELKSQAEPPSKRKANRNGRSVQDKRVSWNENLVSKGILKKNSMLESSEGSWKTDDEKNEAFAGPLDPKFSVKRNEGDDDDFLQSIKTHKAIGRSGPIPALDGHRRPKAAKARVDQSDLS